MIFVVGFGALVFSNFINLAGLPGAMVDWINSLDVSPIVEPLGVDPVWFGIIVIIVVEIGLITPPIGMNVFIVKTVLRDVEVWTIFQGVWPFLVATIVGLGLNYALSRDCIVPAGYYAAIGKLILRRKE